MKRKFSFPRKEPRFAPWLFSLSWEQRKFSEITYPAGEKNKDNLSLESYSITNEKGFVPQDEQFENGGTMRDADKRMYYIVTPFSFAYNPARINVGSIGYHNTLKNIIVSSLYEVFKTSEDVNDRLLWHWFKSPDFRRLIEQLQEGGVRLYFYYDKLCMGAVYLPKIDEQEKIGSLFDTIDRLITLHQCKLRMLSKLRKMQILHENALLRRRQTTAWEQRRLASCATFRRGSFPQPYGKKEWYDGDGAMPFVQVADVTDSMNLADDTKQKISKIAQDMSIFAEKGSVLVTLQGSIGRVAITQYEAFIDRTILIFENYRTKTDAQFWAYLIKQKFIDEARSAPGGTIKTITKEALSDFEMNIPEFFEQEKIGLFLSLIDRIITLHQREFTHTNPNTNYVKYYQRNRPLLCVLRSMDKSV